MSLRLYILLTILLFFPRIGICVLLSFTFVYLYVCLYYMYRFNEELMSLRAIGLLILYYSIAWRVEARDNLAAPHAREIIEELRGNGWL
jgi:hypothetical protein